MKHTLIRWNPPFKSLMTKASTTLSTLYYFTHPTPTMTGFRTIYLTPHPTSCAKTLTINILTTSSTRFHWLLVPSIHFDLVERHMPHAQTRSLGSLFPGLCVASISTQFDSIQFNSIPLCWSGPYRFHKAVSYIRFSFPSRPVTLAPSAPTTTINR